MILSPLLIFWKKVKSTQSQMTRGSSIQSGLNVEGSSKTVEPLHFPMSARAPKLTDLYRIDSGVPAGA